MARGPWQALPESNVPSSVFDPISIGKWESRNRLVVAPMTTYSSQPDGVISADEIPYLVRRAAGGFGIVMTAACCVHPRGKAFDGQWACWGDSFIASLRSVASAIKAEGALAVLQIHHGGRSCPSRLCGDPPLSASAIPHDRPGAETPKAMTDDEIEDAIYAFGQAAERAVHAGFDGIEIHGANTYLLQQFVSPHSNRREDAWGQNRLLFSERIIDEVLTQADGKAFVGYRFSPEEIEEPGIRWSDTAALIDLLCSTKLDYIHASLWDHQMKGLKGDAPEPTLVQIANYVADRKPLIGVGKVLSAEDAERCMEFGADMVAVGRAALTQPNFPEAIKNGEPVRTTIPKTGAGELFTWPKGLEEKAYTVPNWFQIED